MIGAPGLGRLATAMELAVASAVSTLSTLAIVDVEVAVATNGWRLDGKSYARN